MIRIAVSVAVILDYGENSGILSLSHKESFVNRSLLLLLMLAMVILGQISVDIYLPSFPAIVDNLMTTAGAVKLTLTAYLIGVAVSQLFYGPLSDSYGRRRLVMLGLLIYVVGTFLCWQAKSIHLLLAARILQGVGAGSCIVIARAMARDLYQGSDLARVSSYLSMVWALVPILAPVLGGYIQDSLGWRANFSLLFFSLCVFFVIILLRLTETNITPISLAAGRVIDNYRKLLTDRHFMGYAFCPTLMFGTSVAFNVATPFLIQDKLGFSASHYGALLMIPTSFYLIATYANSFLVKKYSIDKIIQMGIFIAIFSALLFLLFAVLGVLNLFTIIAPWSLLFLGFGLGFANCIAKALMQFKDIAGSASAVMGCVQILGGTIISMIVSRLNEYTQQPLALVVMTTSILIFLSFRFLANHHETV